MEILGGIETLLGTMKTCICFQKRERIGFFGEQYTHSRMFLLEVVDSSGRILQECHKVAWPVVKTAVTSLRPAKCLRLRFSA